MLQQTLLETGSPTWLYVSDRLVQFPMGIFAIAVGTVLLPTLSKIDTNKERFVFINSIKKEVESLIATKLSSLKRSLIDKKLAEEKIDITLPSKGDSYGSTHPISQVSSEIVEIFTQFGIIH